MTKEPASPAPAPDETSPPPELKLSQLLVDFGPILVFVLVYNVMRRIQPDEAIYIATGVFIVATLAAIAFSWIRTRHVPPVLIVTGVLITIFGGLTIALHDDNFVKFKPTAMYLFFAVSIFGSILAGHNVWKLLFQHIFVLPDRIWRILALRWGCFFVIMALANEYIRLTMSTDVWVAAKLPTYIVTLAFAAANAPITLKHAGQTTETAS